MGTKKHGGHHSSGITKKNKKKERERKEAVRRLCILVDKHTARESKLSKAGKQLSIDQMIEDILELQSALKDVISSQSGPEGGVQRGVKKSLDEKKAAFKIFSKWLLKVAPECQLGKKWDFDIDVEEGSGVIALEPLKNDAHFMSISRKAMMSEETCWQSGVGKLLRTDQVCQRLPSLALAVYLLFEKLDPSSFHYPYLSILPDPVIPLFF